MPVLFVTEFGSVLRRRGNSLIVTLDEEADGSDPAPDHRRILLEVEPHHLDSVGLVGQVHITSEATLLCLQENLPVYWLSWGGETRGRLLPPQPRNAELRLRQYDLYRNPDKRLEHARKVVAAKLEAAAETLELIQSNYPDSPILSEAMAEIGEVVANVGQAPDVPTLLGLEGAGARVYFHAFGACFRGSRQFSGRQSRPAPDPANALLSFGYTLLGNIVEGVMDAYGFDTSIGFYHELRSGRPSLALDLLEELRHPVVDRFVLRLANLQVFSPDDFEKDTHREGGVRLKRSSIKTLFAQWSEAINRPLLEKDTDDRLPVRALISRQASRLAADFRADEPYRPFRFGD